MHSTTLTFLQTCHNTYMLHDNDLTLVSGDGGEKDGKPVATAQNYVST